MRILTTKNSVKILIVVISLSFLSCGTGEITNTYTPAPGSGGVCSLGTSSEPASASQVLDGRECWDATGSLITGTANFSGAPTSVAKTLSAYNDADLTTPVAATTYRLLPPSVDYLTQVDIEMGAAFAAANIRSGTSIFGLAGSAVCGPFTLTGTETTADKLTLGYQCWNSSGTSVTGTFDPTYSYYMSATLGRTSQGNTNIQTIDEQSADTNADLANYNEVPDIALNTDGSNEPIRTIDGTIYPNANCGTTGTIDERIANCAAAHSAQPTRAIWAGITEGIEAEGTWKLVYNYFADSTHQKAVWKDMQTGLLWSDVIDAGDLLSTNPLEVNWCRASGNAEAGDGYCASNANGISVCHEIAGFTTYDSHAKGNLDKDSTPAVHWRLPTRSDFRIADINGLKYIIKHINNVAGASYWTATTESLNNNYAWRYLGSDGSIDSSKVRNDATLRVICVGRTP